MLRSRYRRTLLLTLPLVAAAGCRAGDPALRVAESTATEHGRRAVDRGLTLVEVWGTPAQAGYAHGYLLAEQIVALFDAYLLDPRIVPSPERYAQLLEHELPRFEFAPDHEAELAALLRGMRDRLGPRRVRSQRLGRPLELADLKLMNVYSDIAGLACSTVSLWGPLTANGETLTARNLDFPHTPAGAAGQIILAHYGAGDRQPWVGVTWPGLIGVYTALNGDGVSMLIHDAPAAPGATRQGFTPRSLILRRALEQAKARAFTEDVAATLRQHKPAIGSNIHVSVPHNASEPPAAVFEYDAAPLTGGLTIRRPTTPGETPPAALVCTNHYAARTATPQACPRWDYLHDQVARMQPAGGSVGVARAFELVLRVRQASTLHTAILEPATRRMWVHLPAVTGQRLSEVDFNALLEAHAERAAATAAGSQP